jgi:hypothetical protein
MSPLEQALTDCAEAVPPEHVLTRDDAERPLHELRFEHDLAERNLEALDRQRERLMARMFRLSRLIDRRTP